MSRAVFVGGFGNGKSSAEKVGSALNKYYEDVDFFTFSEYVKDPTKVQKAAKKVDLITHSAGALALAGNIEPGFVHLFHPPLVKSIGRLLTSTAIKTARMNTPGLGIHKLSDICSAISYSTSSAAELTFNPITNFSQLGRIANFDSIITAIAAKKAKINTEIIWTTEDSYFQPSEIDISRATKGQISISLIPGEHDELILRPKQFLGQVFDS